MIALAAAKGVLSAIGRRLPLRWVLTAAVASALCLLAARYIDGVFAFALWASLAAAAAAAALVVWEVASVYYTGHLDLPGDGVKPYRR